MYKKKGKKGGSIDEDNVNNNNSRNNVNNNSNVNNNRENNVNNNNRTINRNSRNNTNNDETLQICQNESPITLDPYKKKNNDNIITIYFPNSKDIYSSDKSTCIDKNELIDMLSSDLSKRRENEGPPGYFMADWVPRTNSNIEDTGHKGKPGFKLFVKFPINNIYFTYNTISFALSLPGGTPLYAKKILNNQRIGNLYGTFGIGQNHGQSPGFSVYKLYLSSTVLAKEDNNEYPPQEKYGMFTYKEIDILIDEIIKGWRKQLKYKNSNDNSKELSLFTAIKKLNVNDVKNCLDNGANPNYKLQEDLTPIETLIKTRFDKDKSMQIFRLLVDRGGDIYQALIVICLSDDIDYFKYVLDMNLDLYTYQLINNNNNKVSLLYVSFSYGSMKTIDMLLKKYPVNFLFIDEDGNNLLHLIMDNNEMFDLSKLRPKIKLLLEKGVDINHKNDDDETPYDCAIDMMKDQIFPEHKIKLYTQIEIERINPNININDNNSDNNSDNNNSFNIFNNSDRNERKIANALLQPDYKKIKNYLDKGLDPNITIFYNTIIGQMIKFNTVYIYRELIKVTKLLIERGIDLGLSLYDICKFPDNDYFKFIMNLRMDLYSYREIKYRDKDLNLLSCVIGWGDMKKINIMCDIYGDNIDWKFMDKNGNFLLHHIGDRYACIAEPECDFDKKIYFLLNKGIDKNHKNNNGETAYDYILKKHPHISRNPRNPIEQQVLLALELIKPTQTGGKYKWKNKSYIVKTGIRKGKFIVVNNKKKYI